MKELTVFKCDYCGLQFEKENDCLNHERMHVDVNEVKSVSYKTNGAYPCEVKIKMKDDSEFVYIRKDILNEN